MATASIFQSLLRPVKSVAEYDADYDAAEGNKLKLAAARMGMEQTQRGAQQAEARRQAFASSGGDRKTYRNALQRIGDFAGVQELDAADLKSRETEADITLKGSQAKKADADIDAKKFEMAKTRIEIMGQSSKYLMDNPTLEGAMQVTQYLMDNGVIDQGMAQKTVAELQANPTPEYIRQRAEQAFRTALGAKEQLEARMAQNRGGTAAVVGVDPVTGKARDLQSAEITQSADNAASNARQAADAAAGRAVTIRGQNLSDAQAKMRDKTTRETAAAIIGKPLTEGQAKAVLFGARMEAANEILDGLEKKGVTASVPGSRAGYGIGAVITALSSSERQQLDQAKRDFINATLRRESGAVIADSEFDNAEKQYFPQIGDSKEVIAQKKRNREIAMRGIQAEVPEARKGMFREVQGVAPEAVPGGGFKYLGTE